MAPPSKHQARFDVFINMQTTMFVYKKNLLRSKVLLRCTYGPKFSSLLSSALVASQWCPYFVHNQFFWSKHYEYFDKLDRTLEDNRFLSRVCVRRIFGFLDDFWLKFQIRYGIERVMSAFSGQSIENRYDRETEKAVRNYYAAWKRSHRHTKVFAKWYDRFTFVTFCQLLILASKRSSSYF